ncbi:Membrane-associated protease RseP, regulator of RpoE activity [Rathayibacter oskolensis]|uniref:Membrane-associated protease RseP, regulator of RpoE activity n=1 Tax=Rathayibacter oskolensis TaxID=1891671 RepID=A0A1X7NBH5_9MICO|nr:Membrane-associated protease RseP, regulator of RpoE activity [Rathayibacter oskolensis]
MLLFVLGVVIIAVGVALSIALHEVGHLVPAKLFGVKVTQYMIGFGPTLFSRRRGETEYGVKAIPLGGYIAMIGMYPPKHEGDPVTESAVGMFKGIGAQPSDARSTTRTSMIDEARAASAETVGEGEEHRAFYRLAVWKRVVIMFGGPFMNLVIATVLFTVLLCGIGVAQSTSTISTVSQCVVPATDTSTESCSADDPLAPGAAAGILPGDTITSIDDTPVSSWDDLTPLIRESANTPLSVVVERDGESRTLTITPVENEVAVTDASGAVVTDSTGATETQTVGFIGISPTTALVQQPITAVPETVWTNITSVAHVILNLPQRLYDVAQAAFGSEERDANGPISVVGVGRIAGEIAASDQLPVVSKVQTMVGVLASLNVALLVFNLVPLLPMDGGHIAGALWEGLRRRLAKLFGKRDPGPVDIAKLLPLTYVVVLILGSMSALLIYADIVKPIRLF